jgi:LPXTG-motif cell wall-anchored protein
MNNKMKKTILILSLLGLMIANSGVALSQEKPKPKKDTVNMDTDAKPTFYYPVEDEKANKPPESGTSSTGIIIMIAGGAVIVGATVYFMMKKKKK